MRKPSSKAVSAQYAVACPTCEAPPKDPCRTLRTLRVTDTHLDRIERAYPANPDVYSRRKYMILKALNTGCTVFEAMEAVSSVAIENPGWDMEELKSWTEWENHR